MISNMYSLKNNKNIFKYGVTYLTKVLNGMALGLFSSLIIGLILKQIGIYTGLSSLSYYGQIAQWMMGPAIGAGVAYSLKVHPLAIFSAIICGALGAGTITSGGGITIGEPVGAFIASLVGTEVGRLISGKTKFDILLIPSLTIIFGGLTASFISPLIVYFMKDIGIFINTLTLLHPIPMGISLSVVMGIILTLPISSAAISISLGLSGLAAGAATVGCSTHMIGFAVSSYKENKIGGLISQGLGTSMLQVPNIIKKPIIALPVILTSAILGPLSTTIFHMKNNSIGAGMGTSGFVGQIATFETMGGDGILGIFLLHFFLPGILTYSISRFMRGKNWIKFGDLKI